MSQTETLGILDEIESLVSDQLQVVSYKWLSRNFSVSSNSAKRLLKEFAEKSGNGLEVVYSLSGWLKSSPSSYHIRLVSGSKLPEAEKEFNGQCSVQVYSVQASIPTDPAALWNAEFVQAEELFKQPSTVDNCLRDNRFCGISNSFVKRNVEGNLANISALQSKSVGISTQIKSGSCHQENAVPSNQQKKFPQSSPKVSVQLPSGLKETKSEKNATLILDQSITSSSCEEKVPPVPANKKTGKDEKYSSGTGSSLTNLWGRACVKPKNDPATTVDKNQIPHNTEAQISSRDAVDSGASDDETHDVNFKRVSKNDNRKRKVIFDLSDEEYEDAVSLASPDAPKAKSRLNGTQSTKDSISEKADGVSGEMKINEPKVEEEDRREAGRVDSSNIDKIENSSNSSLEKIQAVGSEAKVNPKHKAAEPPTSPKRRKVLKTRIDERGREVTEVVWEGEETDAKKGETDAKKKEEDNTMKKADDHKSANAINRPVASKKSPAIGNTAAAITGGKPGNKKAGNVKDPKQGNILSFFKRV